MFKDFSKFNFTVIEVSAGTVPQMTVNLNGISFSAKTLEVLGNPEFVQPLLDADNKAFAVRICKEKETRAMRFSKNTQAAGYTSTCNTIRHAIRHLMGESWKDSMRYEMNGVYFADAKAVVFDLTAAKELPPFRNSGVAKK